MHNMKRKGEKMTIKIFIDQGHNPSLINAGAQVDGFLEANVTYEVGNYLAQLLNNDPRFEARVSRNNPDVVLGTTIRESLQERVQQANEWNADYFLSIHANANDNENIQGAEVYLYANDAKQERFARDVLDGMNDVTAIKDNGVRINPSLYVLRNTRMPAMLIELGYLTNAEDLQKLMNEPMAFSQGIYVGMNTFFR